MATRASKEEIRAFHKGGIAACVLIIRLWDSFKTDAERLDFIKTQLAVYRSMLEE